MTWDKVSELLDAGQDDHAIELARNLGLAFQHQPTPLFVRTPNDRDVAALDRVHTALIRRMRS